MKTYQEMAREELQSWQKRMARKPSFSGFLTKGLQNKLSNLVPQKIQNLLTEAIKNMTKGVLAGSEFITKQPLYNVSLEEREKLVKEKLNFYKKAAATSGAGTGAGGILLGLADFPILLSLKMKFLFDTASLYGFSVRSYQERLYILYIFQLAFSSEKRRVQVYQEMVAWDKLVSQLPEELDSFDWRTFQQEYRDYIDLVKMLQLVPGIGAVVGAYANYQLMDKLGETAINAYRLRIIKG